VAVSRQPADEPGSQKSGTAQNAEYFGLNHSATRSKMQSILG